MDVTSRIIGTFILIGSLVTNIPQLYSLSGDNMYGMNFWYFLMLCMIYSINIVYNLQRGSDPMDYSENYILLSSTMFIIWMIIINESNDVVDDEKALGHTIYTWIFLVLFLVLLASGIISPVVIDAAQIMVYPLLMVHAIPQIVTLSRLEHRTTLSGLTIFIRTVGDILRVFTSLRELNSNNLMMASAVLSIIANVFLLFQVALNKYAHNKATASGRNRSSSNKFKKIDELITRGKDKFAELVNEPPKTVNLFDSGESGHEFIELEHPPTVKKSYAPESIIKDVENNNKKDEK